MAGYLIVPCFVLLVVSCLADDTATANRANRQADTSIESGNEIIGIQSVAGITSRNGRVSSVGGIRLIPASGEAQKYFFPLNNPKMFYEGPHFGRSALYPRIANIFPSPENFPRISDYRPQDVNDYETNAYAEVRPDLTEIRNPWFQKDVFESLAQPNIRTGGTLGNPWFYPNFNPFMYFW